jgi:hypothetical protein
MNILHIRIELKNPFDRWDYFSNLGCRYGRLFKHKAWEIEHSYYSPMLLDADMRWSRSQDHAGIEIGIGILGYGISFRMYDTRHWDYEKSTYTSYAG